jgi:hypothetical protein
MEDAIAQLMEERERERQIANSAAPNKTENDRSFCNFPIMRHKTHSHAQTTRHKRVARAVDDKQLFSLSRAYSFLAATMCSDSFSINHGFCGIFMFNIVSIERERESGAHKHLRESRCLTKCEE